jgi:uncharacterized protein
VKENKGKIMAVVIIMGLAFFIEACFGFGGGLIAIPFLSLLLPPQEAVYLMLVFQCLKSVLLFSVWRDINWSVLKLMPLGIILGLFIGTDILASISPNVLRFMLGCYLLIFVACDHFKLSWRRIQLSLTTGSLIAGFSGGLISGVTGMGGPALVTYCRTLVLDKKTFRATLIAILTIANVARFMLDYKGIMHSNTVQTYTLPCLSVFTVAMICGTKLAKKLPEAFFQQAITTLLILAAFLLFYRAWG